VVKKIEKPSFTISAGVVVQLVHYLSCLKVDTDKLLSSVGINSSILTSPDERISVEKYIFLEDEAARATKDPYFGLHMGQFMEAGNWSILGYMMMNCKTLAEAFGKSAKYSSIIGNLIKGDIYIGVDTVTISLMVPDNSPIVSRHCYEGFFSSILCLARNLSGRDIRPIEVGLAFPKPDIIDEYNKVFDSKVLFGQSKNYIVMDKKVGSIPVLLPNENLLKYFEDYAKEVITEVDSVNNLTYNVKKLILSNMDNEKLSIKIIAKELSMSVRTLQGYLKAEGTEFSKLLKEMREQLAKKYLGENYTVEDITYLLGFSDSSAFRKAFKKWTNITPKEYRDSNINREAIS
jgi:AraC-like DNA-binding protein